MVTDTKLYPEFQDELRALLNKHSIDAATHTPDYILAGMLCQAIETHRQTREAIQMHVGHPFKSAALAGLNSGSVLTDLAGKPPASTGVLVREAPIHRPIRDNPQA